VVLLESIIEGAVTVIHHLTTQGLAYGSWIGSIPIGCHPLWGVTNNMSLCVRVFVPLQGGGTGGRVKQKRLPMPSRLGLSTQMRPPIASINCLQM
jgi:hypothetical protein